MALRNISNIQTASLYATHEKSLVAKTKKLPKSKSGSNQQQQYQPQYQPQIRTSSPISSTTSDSFDAPPEGVFPVQKHVSIKELAYEKLRKQQMTENTNINKINVEKCKDSSSSRSYGKLKMLAYNNFGHLTVNVIKGKNYKIQGDTYVRINMVPDREKFYQQYQTALIKRSTKRQSNLHLYDEKFSFEVNQSDVHNRLCVSVWSKSPASTNSLISSGSSSSSLQSNNTSQLNLNDQLVGCFSFRIKSLMQNGPDQAEAQWYHLLPENVGILKHFRCHRPPQSKEFKNIEITNVNKDIMGMKRMKFQVTRAQETESFGFTITGNCPCMIGKVDPQKQPFFNGLKPGDFIAALDSKNVSRGTCDSVVKLIKSFKTSFEIEVYREHAENSPVENIYYEIPSVKSFERPRINYNLAVVPEEDEVESEISEDYYNSNDYGMVVRNPFEIRDEIRHVDSDVNTEDEQIDHEKAAMELRRCSVRYMHSQARILSLKNIQLTNSN